MRMWRGLTMNMAYCFSIKLVHPHEVSLVDGLVRILQPLHPRIWTSTLLEWFQRDDLISYRSWGCGVIDVNLSSFFLYPWKWLFMVVTIVGSIPDQQFCWLHDLRCPQKIDWDTSPCCLGGFFAWHVLLGSEVQTFLPSQRLSFGRWGVQKVLEPFWIYTYMAHTFIYHEHLSSSEWCVIPAKR